MLNLERYAIDPVQLELAGNPLGEMERARRDQIVRSLSEGKTVTVSSGGRDLLRYHPDGTVEEFDPVMKTYFRVISPRL